MRLGLLAGVMVACGGSVVVGQQNPITAVVPSSGYRVVLEEVVTIPNSLGTFPRLEELTFAPGSDHAFVLDQNGLVYRFDPWSGSPTPEVFLDVASAVPAGFRTGSQAGLRGLAFHPDFATPGAAGYRKLYTAHSRDAFTGIFFGAGVDPVIYGAPGSVNHDSYVAEWEVDASGAVIESSYREILLVGQPRFDHNVGQIGFNPAAEPGDADYGNLYVMMGDGGGANDPSNLAQNINQPLGSMLRIDPLRNGSDPFSVPGDNPLRVSDDPGTARNLIYAYGLRNPHKFTVDPVTEKMLVADIGQANIEEVNLIVPGGNYGWDVREGTYTINGANVPGTLPGSHPTDAFTYPVAQYDHDPENDGPGGSWAIAGGHVYRGSLVPELTGLYLFGDFGTNSGPIFAADVDDLVLRNDLSNVDSINGGYLAPLVELVLEVEGDGTDRTFRDIVRLTNPGTSRTDLRFGIDSLGEIYLLSKRDGKVRRIKEVLGLLAGDADRNGVVDLVDLSMLATSFGGGGDWSNGDFNGDAVVDLIDLSLLATNFGASSDVPEPVLGLLGGLVLLARRR
ncbi:PQQ-dependent sugar dehydrogenase [Mucisphaera sp.]|uniref:PQQ-dependent sugar dehydrogenase n=1 Tax=Mucisphaera sp. TaxID=2913024 RepID=UPI003D0B8C83